LAVGGFIFGVVVYWVAVRRVIGRPPLMSLLATFAVNMVVLGLGTAAFSTSPYNVNFSLPGLQWQSRTFTGTHLIAAALAIAIAGLLYAFLRFTRPGKAIRAVADNRDAAELVGISAMRVIALTFALGIAIAAIAGALIATLFPFTILSGDQYQLTSFVVAVLGGLGNPVGALLGGILLGILEGAITPFIQVSWIPVIEFALFVIALLVFPSGLMGARVRG